jgi:hypothetical protein
MSRRVYSLEEATKACLDYFDGDQLACDTFISKYALRNEKGELLEVSPEMMHRRLAKEFARIEAKYVNPMSEEEIFNLLKGFKYIVPQGSPMSGIGNEYKLQSLSNCFVIPSPEDSYGSILYTDQEQAQIMKRRGGVGFDISNIRPKGLPTSNAAGTTDGISVFMDRFSNTCREVGQGGRRGALMLTIECFDGFTKILTEDGWKNISEIVKNQYQGKVWTHEGWREIEAYQQFENREIYEIECENGKKIKVTANHKFVVRNIETNEEYLKQIKDVNPEVEELVFYDVTLQEH